jgi:hypothetical protein
MGLRKFLTRSKNCYTINIVSDYIVSLFSRRTCLCGDLAPGHDDRWSDPAKKRDKGRLHRRRPFHLDIVDFCDFLLIICDYFWRRQQNI